MSAPASSPASPPYAKQSFVAPQPPQASVPAPAAPPFPVWQADQYGLKQKTISLGRKFYIRDFAGRDLAFCQGTLLKFKDEFRVYDSEAKARELLLVKQEQIFDAWGTFGVHDSTTGQVVGYISRKFWKSFVRDEWILHDGYRREVAKIHEDSFGNAILTRLPLIGLFIPKRMTIEASNGHVLADFQRKLWSFGTWSVNLSGDPQRWLDRRLILGALILMESIEQGHNVSF